MKFLTTIAAVVAIFVLATPIAAKDSDSCDVCPMNATDRCRYDQVMTCWVNAKGKSCWGPKWDCRLSVGGCK
jgi:hypothetical protein